MILFWINRYVVPLWSRTKVRTRDLLDSDRCGSGVSSRHNYPRRPRRSVSADVPRRSSGICERGKRRRIRRAMESGILSRIDLSSEDGNQVILDQNWTHPRVARSPSHEVEVALILTINLLRTGRRICIYLSHRVIGRSIMLQMRRPELLSLVSCFAAGLSAIYFFGLIITKSRVRRVRVNYLSRREKVRQLWWSATIRYGSKNRYNGTRVGTWSRNNRDWWRSSGQLFRWSIDVWATLAIRQ